MGSNKVIIDGCNVAECKHLWKDNSVINLNFCRINFDNNYFSNGIPCCDKCNKHPDCYFKQLQRAKAELEQYKKSKQKLLEKLKRLSSEFNRDFEMTHIKADELLIQYINDKEIEEAYNDVGKWYA